MAHVTGLCDPTLSPLDTHLDGGCNKDVVV